MLGARLARARRQPPGPTPRAARAADLTISDLKRLAAIEEWGERVLLRRALAAAADQDPVAPVPAPAPAPEPAPAPAPGPVQRAVSLRWLLDFKRAHGGKPHGWEVAREFLAPADGGGAAGAIEVTAATLAEHRARRERAELQRDGEPVAVRYSAIPFEQMLTSDVMECFIRCAAALSRSCGHRTALSRPTAA